MCEKHVVKHIRYLLRVCEHCCIFATYLFKINDNETLKSHMLVSAFANFFIGTDHYLWYSDGRGRTRSSNRCKCYGERHF